MTSRVLQRYKTLFSESIFCFQYFNTAVELNYSKNAINEEANHFGESGDGRVENAIEKGPHPTLDKNKLILFLHTKNSDAVETRIKTLFISKIYSLKLCMFDFT